MLEYLHRAAFYLPGVEREFAWIDDPRERRTARMHVWRRLFRSWQYWVLFAIVSVVSVVAVFGGLFYLGRIATALAPGNAGLRIALHAAYALILIFGVGYGGMWPLRGLVLRELRAYLCSTGRPVCLHCGYSLAGAIDPRCSECGTAFEHPATQ